MGHPLFLRAKSQKFGRREKNPQSKRHVHMDVCVCVCLCLCVCVFVCLCVCACTRSHKACTTFLCARNPTWSYQRRSGDFWILLALRIYTSLVQNILFRHFEEILLYKYIVCSIPLFLVLSPLMIDSRWEDNTQSERRSHTKHTPPCLCVGACTRSRQYIYIPILWQRIVDSQHCEVSFWKRCCFCSALL